MKRFALSIICFLFIAGPLMAKEPPRLERGHNTVEIAGLQSIDISPVVDVADSSSIDMISQDDGTVFHVSRKPILTLHDFRDAKASSVNGVVSLNLGLTHGGAARINAYSAKNLGRRLAFIVNGKLLKAPKLKTVIDAKGMSIDPIDAGTASELADLINGQK